MILATLGPEGTFSHQVALSFPHRKIVFAKSLTEVFDLLHLKVVDAIVVPIENSLSGTIVETLRCLADCSHLICEEKIVPIEYVLASFVKEANITKLFAHPHAYEQCRMKINHLLIDVEVIYTLSNAQSAHQLLKHPENSAAITTQMGAELTQVPILYKEVEDDLSNQTRFFLIGTYQNKPTGKDKTSLFMKPSENRCGLLNDILSLIAQNHLNLTKIESLPSKKKLGEYLFYLEIEGHFAGPIFQKMLPALKKISPFDHCGSYPQRS